MIMVEWEADLQEIDPTLNKCMEWESDPVRMVFSSSS